MAGTGRYFFMTHTGIRRYPTKAAAVAAGRKYIKATGVGVVINVEDDDVRVPREVRSNPAKRASKQYLLTRNSVGRIIKLVYDTKAQATNAARLAVKQGDTAIKIQAIGPTHPEYYVSSNFRRNPAIFGGSVASHRHRGLGSGYTASQAWTELKKGWKALKAKTKPLAKRATKVASDLPGGKHYVTLKVGPKEVTEVFESAEHAKQFAKAAKKQGFADAVVY